MVTELMVFSELYTQNTKKPFVRKSQSGSLRTENWLRKKLTVFKVLYDCTHGFKHYSDNLTVIYLVKHSYNCTTNKPKIYPKFNQFIQT